MSLYLHRPLPLRPAQCARALSTTLSRSSSLHIEKNDPELVADTVPAYPYGPARWYKKSDSGLYGMSRVQFGNNIGPKFQTKTRRMWHPNIVRKRLWSHALGRHVQIRVQTRVLRTIDKVGGLDEYLLGEKEGRIKELGMTGWWLRWAIMQTPHIKSRFAKERLSLGLPKDGVDSMLRQPQTTAEGKAPAPATRQNETEIIPTRRSTTFRQARLLKFRVGRGAHFVYTSKGWRRAAPDPRVRGRAVVLRRSQRLRNYVAVNLKKAESPPMEEPTAVAEAASGPIAQSLMQQVLQEQGLELTYEEQKAVRKAVGKALRAKQERLVAERVERPYKKVAKEKAEKAKEHQRILEKRKTKLENRAMNLKTYMTATPERRESRRRERRETRSTSER